MHQQAASEAIVRFEDVVKVYRAPGSSVAVEALRGVTTTIQRGDYMAIVGPSGSGKSTLMNIIGCLDRPSAGRYWLDGRDVAGLDDDELSDVRGKRIGFVFQNFNLISTQSVVENIETPLFYQDLPAHQRRERALEMAQRVGLAKRVHHRPHELSGGEQQRVAIARALINDPAILLADEPTGNLDSKTGCMVLDVLDQLNAAGRTVVIVTHDPNVARRCRRTIEIHDGLISEAK